MKVKSLSRVRLFSTPWSAAYQAPPSMGFSRQEYWSGVPLPSARVAYWIIKKVFATLWTIAYQVPLSIGFSTQIYWSGLPGPPPGDLPDPGTEPAFLMSHVLAGGFFTTSAT